jgi:ferredoxin
MAYQINPDKCICCGTCIAECPNGAIREGERVCVINPDRCTECVGAHEKPECAVTCPVEAPGPDPARKESRQELLAKFKKLHPNRKAAYV